MTNANTALDDAQLHASADPDLETLEKFDRESRVRAVWNTWLKWPLTILAVGLSLYHLYTAAFGPPPQLLHRSIHVACILMLAFALHRPWSRERRDTIPWFDYLLMAAAASTAIYLIVSWNRLIERGGRFETIDVVFSVILVLLVLEAARRLTGWILPLLAIAFLFFDYYGRLMPGFFKHRGYDWDQIFSFMYLTTEGVFSTAIGVASSYIFLFILFGAFLQKSGMGQFFNDIALALAGQSRGGPAKVAVIASGFLGSINGSAIANVVTTGAFTIPLMKRVGYKANFAGAVESAASVGGQILPPVMGAAAFIMAETLGIPYAQVALVALVPALLYYLGIIAQVHLRATSLGLKGISRENLPLVKAVMKERGHLLIPLVFLIYMLFFSGMTILMSAVLTILVTIAAAMLRKTTRLNWRELLEGLRDGAVTAVSVSVACACVGIVVGVATQSGFGVKLANAIVEIGGGMLLPTLLMTAVACIILGMGLPSIPAYIITATMAAPALVQLGVAPLAAHMFVFYFGLFANITPPVALAAFAAAGLSGGSPMKTGFTAMRLAIAGFVVPFVFVYHPALLYENTTPVDVIRIIAASIVAVLVLAVVAEGHLMVPLPWWLRVWLAVGAVLLLVPDTLFNLGGIGMLVVGLAGIALLAKRADKLSLRNI